MYHAKERGRGSVGRYDPRTRPDLERRAEGSRLLRLALEARQLVPYYQPIVDLHSGRMVGAEALVRWEDPARGLVEAKDFIPLAEELGLIGEISELVLAQAGRQATEWSELFPGMKVTVNVSALQLRGAALLTSVRALVKEGMRPASLVLEVTESALMEDTATSGAVLGELREAGFGVAIDDFGTGYSSLAYLRQFPVDSLKIDRTFITGLELSSEAHALTHTLIQLGKALGLQTLAEGVERQDQVRELQREGCDLAQGFLFARPLTADALEGFLRGTPGLTGNTARARPALSNAR
jgi:EAL domain-containing protein (putative c-di-GMP-specific phosphodiesterase class I)